LRSQKPEAIQPEYARLFLNYSDIRFHE